MPDILLITQCHSRSYDPHAPGQCGAQTQEQHCLGGGPHLPPAAVAAALAAAPLPWADPEEWDDIAGKLDGHMLEIQNGPDAGGFFS